MTTPKSDHELLGAVLHKEGRMLYMISDKGELKLITKKLVTKDEIKALEHVLPQAVEYVMVVLDSINDDLFFCGKNLGGNWGLNHTPLDPIYQHFGDEKISALFLGRLVYDIMIDRPDAWCCTKSDFLKRDFSTMAYWPRRADRGQR